MSSDDVDEQDSDDLEFGPRASIRRNVSQMMTSQLVTWVLATVIAVIVPRFLGPSLQGQLRLATSLWLIIGIFVALGTSRFLQLEIARNRRSGLRLVGPVLVIRTWTFAASALVLAAYLALTTDDETFVLIMVLVGAGALVRTWSETVLTVFIGLEQMSTSALVPAITKFVNVLGVVAVIGLGGDVYGLLGVALGAAAIGLVMVFSRFAKWDESNCEDGGEPAPQIVRGGFPFMMGGTALILYQQIDVVVIVWAAESEDVGWYTTADVLFGSLLFPVTVVTATIFPVLGRLHAEDPGALVALVERTFLTIIVVAVPVGLGTTLVAPTFAPQLFGEEFKETGVVLAILGPVLILTFTTILFGTVAQSTGRVRLWFWVMLAAAILTIPLDLVLVPWASNRFENGAIGGAIAFVVTESLQFVVGLLVVGRHLIRWSVIWYVLRVLAAGGFMFLAGWPIRHVFLPAPVVVCAVVYGALIVAFRLITDDHRHFVGRVIDRLGVREALSR